MSNKLAKPKHWSHVLKRLRVCDADAVAWAIKQPTVDYAWWNCERSDWMIRALTLKLDDDPKSPARRKLALCIADIVRRALPHADDQMALVQVALDATTRWGYNNATMAELKAIKRVATQIRSHIINTNRSIGNADAVRACNNALSAACNAVGCAIHDGRNAALSAHSAILNGAASARHAALSRNLNQQNAMESELLEQARIIRRHYPHPPNLAIRSARRKTATSQR